MQNGHYNETRMLLGYILRSTLGSWYVLRKSLTFHLGNKMQLSGKSIIMTHENAFFRRLHLVQNEHYNNKAKDDLLFVRVVDRAACYVQYPQVNGTQNLLIKVHTVIFSSICELNQV